MSVTNDRKRDAAATREDILQAARELFQEKGYDEAGVREIASRAGVNAALINRYFGSKAKLFDVAIIEAINIDYMLEGDKGSFGKRMGEMLATKVIEKGDFDPTLALIRSIGSPVVGERLSASLENDVVERISSWLGGRNARQRAALIMSEIIGVDVLRRMAKLDSLSHKHKREISKRLAKTLQSLVDG